MRVAGKTPGQTGSGLLVTGGHPGKTGNRPVDLKEHPVAPIRLSKVGGIVATPLVYRALDFKGQHAPEGTRGAAAAVPSKRAQVGQAGQVPGNPLPAPRVFHG